jgi:mandelate racemase
LNVTQPKIRELRVRTVRVPMTPHQTASGTVSESPLVLTDIVTEEGVSGHSIVFTYTALALEPTAAFLRNLEPLVQGEPLAPGYIEQRLSRRFRLLGTHGLVGMALAGLDMALWDALARTHETSLVRLLGGIERPVKAYGAIGYDGVSGSAKVAEDWAKRGFRGVKAKIGYPTAAEDLEVIHAIRRAAGPDMAILVDYNQSLNPAEAVQRLRAVDDEGLTWIEEPVLANDFQGHAKVAREIRTPIQAGENWWGELEVQHAIDAGASDFLMLDVMKAGGVTGWMRGAGIAASHGIPVSNHLWPEISAQLLCVTPTAHWLEYSDWWNPIVAEPIRIENGHAVCEGARGSGVEWNETAIARYAG